jgi:hypothetical protein
MWIKALAIILRMGREVGVDAKSMRSLTHGSASAVLKAANDVNYTDYVIESRELPAP